MKELLKKRYEIYINLLDEAYKQDLINEHGRNFKYIFEVPTNYCIYPNYQSEHDAGYLVDGYYLEEEYEYIDMVLAPLGYSNLMESTYGWENGNDPIFSKEEIIEMLNKSKFIEATMDCPFTDEKEELENGKDMQEDYRDIYSWTEQKILESLEDEIASFNV